MQGSLRAVVPLALSSPPLAGRVPLDLRTPACSPIAIRTTPSASAGQQRRCSGKGDAGGTSATGWLASRGSSALPELRDGRFAQRPAAAVKISGPADGRTSLILHADDDQIVAIGASALLPPKVVEDARLEIHPGAPHGLSTTRKDRLDADLLAFIRAWGVRPAAVDRRHANPRGGVTMPRVPSRLTMTAAIVLAILGGTAVSAQDKYALKSPGGIAFSDFRGYEDWAVVSSARTDEVLKVIVANPAMIEAYKAGVPGNGQPFPEGSKIAKLQWKPKKSTEAPFDVDVPDVFTQAFVIEKDSKRFPNTGGWGYALFNYDAATGTFTADAAPATAGTRATWR